MVNKNRHGEGKIFFFSVLLDCEVATCYQALADGDSDPSENASPGYYFETVGRRVRNGALGARMLPSSSPGFVNDGLGEE